MTALVLENLKLSILFLLSRRPAVYPRVSSKQVTAQVSQAGFNPAEAWR